MRPIRLALLMILALTIPAASAWAVNITVLDDTPYLTTNIHTVTEYNPYPVFVTYDDGPKTVFQWDEEPFYRLNYTLSGVTDVDTHNYLLYSTWTYLGDGSQYSPTPSPGFCSGCNGGETNLWRPLPDWHTNRAAGFWTLDLDWNMDGGDSEFTKQLSFQISAPTVTPEPASMALFGLGAAALSLTRRRKK